MNIAIIIPCLNEEKTIGSVVTAFAKELPNAHVIVFDNNSTDRTAEIAARSGAIVVPSPRKGKGAVLRHAFRGIEADFYIIVDGDDTYPAEAVHAMLDLAKSGADMVCGDRLSGGHYSKENKRPLHSFGNKLICDSIRFLFNRDIKDALTGYRVMSRRFVKNCPILIDGFAVETEMTIHAIDKLFDYEEISIAYRDRPPGSFSKLDTFSDGLTVMRSILWLFKDAKPLIFFSFLTGLQLIMALLLLAFSAWNFESNVLAILPGILLILTSAITFATGLMLDSVVRFQREKFEIRMMNISKAQL